jgi:hypothetical protein
MATIRGTVPSALSKVLVSKALEGWHEMYRKTVEALVEPANSSGWRFIIDNLWPDDGEEGWGFVARDGDELVQVYLSLRMRPEAAEQYLINLAELCGLPLASTEEEATIREHMRQIRFGKVVRELAARTEAHYLKKYFIRVDKDRKEASFVGALWERSSSEDGDKYSPHFKTFYLDHLVSAEERRGYLVDLARKHGLPVASQSEEAMIRRILHMRPND